MIREELQKYLKSLEDNLEPLDEFNVAQEINKVLNAREEKVTDPEELAELFAFEFMPSYQNKETSWGTYYGPKFVLKNDKGQFVEFPSINLITVSMIEHWKQRSDSPHPVLARQYADLVLDFEPRIAQAKLNYLFVQKVIDRTIDICNNNLDDGLGCKSKLLRAFELAKTIGDKERLDKLKTTIILTEEKYAEDDKPGLWGHSFEWLVLGEPKNVIVTEEEKLHLIEILEKRLDRLMATDSPDPWRVERAVQLLSDYYSKIQNAVKVEESVTKLETAFRKNTHANSDGLLITNYLEKLLDIYSGLSSKFPFAQEAYERILQELSSPETKRKFDGHEISVEIPITQEDKDSFILSIFGDNPTEDRHIEKVIGRMSIQLIPRKDSVEKQLKEIAQKHPLQFLMGGKIISEDGYTLAEMGSLDEDFDQRLLEHFSKNLHFQSVFLHMAFAEMKKRFSIEDVYTALALSPVFREEDKHYILKLLKAFWDADYLTVSCLAVPLIEDATRNLFRMNKVTFIKPSRYGGGFDVLSLGELFRKGLIKHIFQKLGETVEYYFKVLLTEKVGWNLRNNFAHGINKWAFSAEEYASRLLHVIFCLSLIRKNENTQKENEPKD